MLLFALECSAAAASAALYRDDRLLGEEFLNIPQTHSVTLLPMAQSLFERIRTHSLSFSDTIFF